MGKVSKYIYLSTVLKYNFEEFVLEYFQISVLVLLLHYISEGNIVLLLHYIHLKTLVTSYFADIHSYIIKHALNTLALFYTFRLFENSRSTSSQRLATRGVVLLLLLLYFYFCTLSTF